MKLQQILLEATDLGCLSGVRHIPQETLSRPAFLKAEERVRIPRRSPLCQMWEFRTDLRSDYIQIPVWQVHLTHPKAAQRSQASGYASRSTCASKPLGQQLRRHQCLLSLLPIFHISGRQAGKQYREPSASHLGHKGPFQCNVQHYPFQRQMASAWISPSVNGPGSQPLTSRELSWLFPCPAAGSLCGCPHAHRL